jgi:hypothetical protein
MLRTGIFRAPPVTDGAFLFSATSDRLGPCDGRMQGHVGEPLARFSCLSCERAARRRRFSSVSMGRPEVASRLEAVSGTLVCSEERPRKVDSSTCAVLGHVHSDAAVQPPHSKYPGAPELLGTEKICAAARAARSDRQGGGQFPDGG